MEKASGLAINRAGPATKDSLTHRLGTHAVAESRHAVPGPRVPSVTCRFQIELSLNKRRRVRVR